MTPILSVDGISVAIGGKPLIEDASFAVAPRDRLCLVGRNGSGKSTLLKIAAGLIEPDGGKRFVQPGTTIRYLSQEPDLTGFATTLAYVEEGLGPSDEPHRARYLLEELGLRGDEDPQRLSGGEARRCALARALAPDPDILLLDEPTNHLDLPAIEWLEGELKSSRSALILISHDRRFLGGLSRATLWLDRGRLRQLDRGFAEFEPWRDELLEQEEVQHHKLGRKIAMEEDWLRYGVTARRKRNQKRLATLGSMRSERREAKRAVGSVRFQASEGTVSGKTVIEAEAVSKSYGADPIVAALSLRIARGDRLGIIGPNGAGKTTLLNLLTGALEPDEGRVRLGSKLEIAVIDQRRADLDPQSTLRQAMTGGGSDTVTVGGVSKHVMGYLKDFLFTPEQANSPVGVLSGGERGRLMLARALTQPSNLLVLDEPTNDLDLDTLDLLQELVADYPGTVLLVSHDRDFIDRTVTSVLVAEGGGRWVEYAGGYSDMVAQRGAGISAKPIKNASPTTRKEERAPLRQPGAPPKRRLAFQEQHDLKTLPKLIEAAAGRITKLQGQLADPNLYARDPALFTKSSAALSKTQAELATMEDRWLALEMLREELERAG